MLDSLFGRAVRSARSEAATFRRWVRLRDDARGAPVLAKSSQRPVTWLAASEPITNPSIVLQEVGIVVAARTVTYRLSRLRQRAVPMAGVCTKTVLLAGGGAQTLEFPPGAPGRALEDPRLFSWSGGLWGLWSRSERLGPGRYENTMVMGRIIDGRVDRMTVFESPYGRLREKNWMPLVDGDRLMLVYGLPELEVFEVVDGRLVPRRRESGPRPELGGHAGSSQFIRYEDGWLGVSHRNLRRPRSFVWMPYANYWHHLVQLNDDLSLRRVSGPFHFSARGVEFCAGIARVDDSFVFSFGSDDDRAGLLRLGQDEVSAMLRQEKADTRTGAVRRGMGG